MHLAQQAGRLQLLARQFVEGSDGKSPAGRRNCLAASSLYSLTGREPGRPEGHNLEATPMKAFKLSLLSLSLFAPCVLAQISLQPDITWHVQLQGTPQNVDRQLYDIDLFDTPQATIADFKSKGHVVICYFSAGTYEDWRPDAQKIPESVRGNNLADWPGERWLNIASDQLKPAMAARFDLAKQKGCDGIDADNVDGYSNQTGFPLTKDQQVAYNRWLAEQAHSRGLLIGLKNALELVNDLSTDFDFAVNESCFDWNECEMLQPFTSQGRPVFAIDYGGFDQKRCDRAQALGISLQFYDKSLSSVGKPCSGGGASGSTGTSGSGTQKSTDQGTTTKKPSGGTTKSTDQGTTTDESDGGD